jgi:hypothetical protein
LPTKGQGPHGNIVGASGASVDIIEGIYEIIPSKRFGKLPGDTNISISERRENGINIVSIRVHCGINIFFLSLSREEFSFNCPYDEDCVKSPREFKCKILELKTICHFIESNKVCEEAYLHIALEETRDIFGIQSNDERICTGNIMPDFIINCPFIKDFHCKDLCELPCHPRLQKGKFGGLTHIEGAL